MRVTPPSGRGAVTGSDEREQARGGTLHGLLHVLAEMVHLGLRLIIGEIAGGA